MGLKSKPAVAGLSKWRRPKDVRHAAGLIGPNAVLQLLPVLERAGGLAFRDKVLAEAGIFDLPGDDTMMPEAPAARLHQALRHMDPQLAPSLAWEAGVRTGEYILKHRIPAFAQIMLKVLPRPLAARALTAAIAKHAWTFAGSGDFSTPAPMQFEIADNPIVRGETADHPICHWHRAVFETLFTRLVDPKLVCIETTCCAAGADACRFALVRRS